MTTWLITESGDIINADKVLVFTIRYCPQQNNGSNAQQELVAMFEHGEDFVVSRSPDLQYLETIKQQLYLQLVNAAQEEPDDDE